MSTDCTWHGCSHRARHVERDGFKNVFARLCRKHHGELTAIRENGDQRETFRAYTLAQGMADAKFHKPERTPFDQPITDEDIREAISKADQIARMAPGA